MTLCICLLAGCATVGNSPSQHLTASWYGTDFHGKPTASGGSYNMHAHTAAHRSLPFGTRLRVTYPKTGRSTTVTVNDRGPYVAGRQLDLSYAAARDIGLTNEGVGRVLVQVIGADSSYPRESALPHPDPGSRHSPTPSSPYAVQLASFSRPGQADLFRSRLGPGFSSSFVLRSDSGRGTFYRVFVGPFPTKSDAESAADRARALGHDPLIRHFPNA